MSTNFQYKEQLLYKKKKNTADDGHHFVFLSILKKHCTKCHFDFCLFPVSYFCMIILSVTDFDEDLPLSFYLSLFLVPRINSVSPCHSKFSVQFFCADASFSTSKS